jgi:sulfate/thiosulfate transport system substrate-binding protein
MRRTIPTLLALLVAVAGSVAAASISAPAASARSMDIRLNLVAYSTPKPVLTKIISDFQATPEGKGVSFNASYGGSSAQAAAVKAGLPADVVLLNTGADMLDLADAGILNPKWDRQSYKGVAFQSVVVFALRNGNPKKIKGWNDLIKPGVQIITPNPFTAGIAKWNILAAYAAQRALGKTDAQGQAFVKKLFDHVVAQDSSGSNATNTFLSGKGDVLLTFESEAINARAAGRDIQYVIPRQTMLIDVYTGVTSKSENKDAANAFLRFLKSPAEQQVLAQNGYRPVNKAVAKQNAKLFPVRPGEITIDNKVIGGWRAAGKKWFDPNNSIMARIEKALGVSTAG